MSGAEARHPVAGTGHGYYYGHNGYYYGNSGHYYGHSGHYSSYYPYYSSYRPYYAYPYYYGYPYVGLSLGWSSYSTPPAYGYAPYPDADSGDYTYGMRTPPDAATDYGPDRGYARSDDRAMPPQEEAQDAGELRLRVWPSDATVYIDGQFYGAARDHAVIRLAPGRHTLAVVRPGYQVEERSVDMNPREPRELSMELRRH